MTSTHDPAPEKRIASAATAATSLGTVVVGAGQAGLAVGYHLARHRQDFVILEAASSAGASWRNRWDSLTLFTPAGFTRLPGLAFPAERSELPGKDAVADYLATYAERFALPVELRTPVQCVRRHGKDFLVVTGSHRWQARSVVLATGAHAAALLPSFAHELHPAIVQVHSSQYRRPDQLPAGTVLIVGAGNSGAEIALDLAADRSVHLAGRDVGHVPNLGPWTYAFMQRLGRTGATLSQRALRGGADPLGKIKPGQLEAAGIRRRPRVDGVRDGLPLLSDATTVDADAIVWCTGFRPDYSWLDLDVLDRSGRLKHNRGIVTDEPGLYTVGLPYQRSITSHLLGGVGADAEYVVDHLVSRLPQQPPTPSR